MQIAHFNPRTLTFKSSYTISKSGFFLSYELKTSYMINMKLFSTALILDLSILHAILLIGTSQRGGDQFENDPRRILLGELHP